MSATAHQFGRPADGVLGRHLAEIVLDGHASHMDIGASSLDRLGARQLRAEVNVF